MYSNPSRFAPKVRKTGGEAYPQAPTMDQFYSYGAPTPQTPFVFQDGGSMNDIQKMHSRFKNHYMKKGGVTSFEESKPNRTNNFLSAIKNRAYNALQKELEQEEMNLQQGYNQAAMDMDMGYMQYGGNYGYNMDFTAANQWAKAADNTANMNKAFGNFGKIAEAFAGTPTETYIKSIKYKPMPIAQMGLNLTDQAELPFNYGSYPISSGMMYGVNAMNPSYGNMMTENIPGMGTPVTGLWRDTPMYSDDEYLPELQTQQGPVDASIIDPIRRRQEPVYDYMQGKDMYPIREREEPSQLITPKDIPAGGLRGSSSFNTNGNSIVEKTLGDLKTKREEAEKRRLAEEAIYRQVDEAVKKKKLEDTLPPAGTEIVKNPDGTESSISPAEAARRKAEAAKNPDCPDGNCNKPKDGSSSSSGNQPVAGSQEEKQKAAAAGMTPEQYRTFLTRATVNNRRALLPGNRLKSMDFYFDTYGPGMNPITASANQQKPFFYDNATGKMEGAVPSGMTNNLSNTSNSSDPGNGFLRRLFGRPDQQSRWNTENDVSRFSSKVKNVESPVMESQFETQGYSDKNYMPDFRNQRATNRLQQLGERLDRNMQREMALDKFYGAPISNRMERLRNRDLRRYNRIADRFNRDEYIAPAFGYGGNMNYFQPGGENEDPTIDELPETLTDMQGNQYNNYAVDRMKSNDLEFSDYGMDKPEDTIDLEKGDGMNLIGRTKATATFGQYNPYEAPMYMAGLDVIGGMGQNLDASQKEKELKNKTTASEVFTSMPDMSRGNYTANEGYFRPDKQVPTQFTGYNFKSPYAKMGGSYKKGGEYYLTQEEIDEIIAMGGQVEFLD